jgi:hypothetical protein
LRKDVEIGGRGLEGSVSWLRRTSFDYFTPYNQAEPDQNDKDPGSSGPALLPPQPGPYPNLAVIAGKEGMIYLVNRDNLGGYNSLADQVVQEVRFEPDSDVEIYGGAAYWNQFVYFGGEGVPIEAFSRTNGFLLPAILYAYDATNISTMLYGSAQVPSRDQGVCVESSRYPRLPTARFLSPTPTFKPYSAFPGAVYIVSAYANGLSPLLFQKYARMITLATAA